MRSYIDEVRLNVCRYAKKGTNAVYYDYSTRKGKKKYKEKLDYKSYAFKGNYSDKGEQHTNFNKELSVQLFKKCRYRVIPIVITPSTRFQEDNAADGANKDEEVDGRLMDLLMRDAFHYDKNKSKEFQPVKVPVLARTAEEAWSKLEANRD